MPRPNFSKLKGRTSSRENGSGASSGKKQATISRFFSSGAKKHGAVSTSSVVEDAPISAKEKLSSPVKVVSMSGEYSGELS